MHVSKLTLASLFFISCSQMANASPVDATSLLNQYNLITSGDVTSTSEVEGNTLIGGNIDGGMYNMHQTSNAVVPALTVGGNVNGNVITKGKGLNVGGNIAGNVTMNDGGDAFVGSVSGSLQNNANGSGSTSVIGDISGNVNTNGGNTIYGGNLTGSANANGGGSVSNQPVTAPFEPATQASNAMNVLSNFSNQLSGLDANSGYSINGGKVTFNAVGNDSGLAIFSITDASSFFDKAFEFDFSMTNTQNILFNVFGGGNTEFDIKANFLASAATLYGSMFLWNFVDATELNLASQFGGNILALNAAVTNSNNIEGTLAAKSLTQYGEIHSQPTDFVPPAAVPVPAALPLFLSGLIGFFSLRRNRKKTL